LKKTLIYIIGAGRSGTTMLDIVLGNTSESLSLGEINRFFKRNGIPPKRNIKDKTFLFWKKIREDFEIRNENIFLSFFDQNQLMDSNEYHSAVFKSVFGKCDKNYKTLLNNLYDSIFANTTDKIIIESSKYPLRALNLSRLERKDVEIKYIYLKKDPVKVVKSFNKKDIEQPTKGFFKSNIYYFGVNALCIITVYFLKRRGHKIAKIKYEDLILNPNKTLKKLATDLSENLNIVIGLIDKKIPLKIGYLFDGNRIRLKESLILQPIIDKQSKGVKYYLTRVLNYLIYN
tara:strand:+ start:9906 stop:10769 length:864 start_codon:yes stop_codon:yes gene_type:complete